VEDLLEVEGEVSTVLDSSEQVENLEDYYEDADYHIGEIVFFVEGQEHGNEAYLGNDHIEQCEQSEFGVKTHFLTKMFKLIKCLKGVLKEN
jgi:hypothetical protein